MYEFIVKLRGITERVNVKAKSVIFGEHFVVFQDETNTVVAGFASETVAHVQRSDVQGNQS